MQFGSRLKFKPICCTLGAIWDYYTDCEIIKKQINFGCDFMRFKYENGENRCSVKIKTEKRFKNNVGSDKKKLDRDL